MRRTLLLVREKCVLLHGRGVKPGSESGEQRLHDRHFALVWFVSIMPL